MILAQASSTAGIVTACAAIGGLITTITGLLVVLGPLLRKTNDIHTIVNQQHTNMQNYQAALVTTLNQAGVPVPTDQSDPTPPPTQTVPPVIP